MGKLNIYSFGKSFNTKPSLSINGRNRFDQAGYSSDIGDPFGNGSSILAVGIPGMDVIGRVDSSSEKFTQGGGGCSDDYRTEGSGPVHWGQDVQ